jgi:ubiquinol-cytochrome c reductase iron-sulfur subunit
MRHSAIATVDQLDNRTKEWQEPDHVRAGISRPRDREGVFMAAAEHQAHSVDRRDFIYIATGAFGAVGAGAVAWPFISQMNPDRSTIAAGAPVEVDLSPVAEGSMIKIFWRGKPIFVRHRTAEEIKVAADTPLSDLKDPQADADRVKEGHAQWLIVFGNCTHLGCVPLGNAGDFNGWFCPCHGSHYDTSGRIRIGPAPLNLPVPSYSFTDDSKVVIG